MFQRLGAIFGFQEVDQLLDAIALSRDEDQDRILGGNDNDIVDADDGRQMFVGANMNIRRIHDDAAAPDRIALAVAFRQLPHRLPIADI